MSRRMYSTPTGGRPTSGPDRTWKFAAEPSPDLNGRKIDYPMGRGLGGGSGINVAVWAHGHQSDWDHHAQESSDPDWGYQAALDIYRRVEDWHGQPDPRHRGSGGPMHIQPAPDVHPFFAALLDGAEAAGLPRYPNPNGELAEAEASGT